MREKDFKIRMDMPSVEKDEGRSGGRPSPREGDRVTTYALHPLHERSRPRSPVDVACIDSWPINVPDQHWLIERLLQDAAEGHGGTVFTINLDHLAKLRSDEGFRSAYRRATYVSADGMPVVVMARAEGVPIERVTGADLVVPLARAAAGAGLSVYFFGGRLEVLERAVAQLRAEIPELLVAGIESPPMGFDPLGAAAREASERIAASGAAFCFVALGAPKQEIFADASAVWSPAVMHLGIGAALDFLAGERRRAPRFFQRLGLEWLWRTLQEPRRLVPRYLRSAAWLVGYGLRILLGITRDGRRPADTASKRHAAAPPPGAGVRGGMR